MEMGGGGRRERREYIMKMGMGCEEGPRAGKGGAEGREEGWVQVCGGDERERERGWEGGRGGREGKGETGASVSVLVSRDVAVGRDPAEGYSFVSRVEAGQVFYDRSEEGVRT